MALGGIYAALWAREGFLIPSELCGVKLLYMRMARSMASLIVVKGFGPVSCWTIIAHLSEITSLDRAEATALAGLAPFNRDSGKHEGPRSIFGDRSRVRSWRRPASAT